MKLYFAGADSKNHCEHLIEVGAQNILQSFHYINKTIGPYTDDKSDLLMDSGGYTSRVAGVEIKVEDYAEFINRYGLKKCFNLDTIEVDETLNNQAFLEKECPNTYIIPIIHLSDWKEKEHNYLLDYYCEKYPYIGAGGWAGLKTITDEVSDAYMDWIFRKTQNKTKVHGLGIATLRIYKRYPFYSVDHTTWVSFNKYGRSVYFERKRKKKDIDLLRYWYKTKTYWEKTRVEIEAWQDIEREMTNIWEHRGVVWDDFDVDEWIKRVK